MQAVLADNISPTTPSAAPAPSDQPARPRVASTEPPSSQEGLKAPEDGEWSADKPPPWPKDAVIDHLLICVHGEAMTEAGLKSCIDSMRKNSDYVAKRLPPRQPCTLLCLSMGVQKFRGV